MSAIWEITCRHQQQNDYANRQYQQILQERQQEKEFLHYLLQQQALWYQQQVDADEISKMMDRHHRQQQSIRDEYDRLSREQTLELELLRHYLYHLLALYPHHSHQHRNHLTPPLPST